MKIPVLIAVAVVCPVLAQNSPGQAEVKPVRLRLRMPFSGEERQRLSLLPTAQDLAAGDAYPVYQVAIKAIPENLNRWDQIPVEDISTSEIKTTVDELRPVLEGLRKAALCRDCTWPPYKPNDQSSWMELRPPAYALSVEARYSMAKGDYARAAKAIGGGLAMARHTGRAQNLTQQLIGVAAGTLMCREVEQWVQCPSSPSLYEALKDLPRPFIDPNEQIQREIQAARSDVRFILAREALDQILKPAHDRMRLTARRLDRHIAALQCIEALRLYAARQGRFPQTLAEVGLNVPNDPMMDRPFVYAAKTETTAMLEGPIPQGGSEREGLQYELTWIKDQ